MESALYRNNCVFQIYCSYYISMIGFFVYRPQYLFSPCEIFHAFTSKVTLGFTMVLFFYLYGGSGSRSGDVTYSIPSSFLPHFLPRFLPSPHITTNYLLLLLCLQSRLSFRKNECVFAQFLLYIVESSL